MLAINPWIYKLHSDPATAFAPVSLFSDLPFVLVVPTTLPAKNVKDTVALARAQPASTPSPVPAPAARRTCRARYSSRPPAPI